MAVLRERMLGTLGIIVFALLLWSSALLPVPFRVGIDRPLRMRFEYPMTELRVVVDSDASTREVWVWIPFYGWEKRWSGSCAIPEAGYCSV